MCQIKKVKNTISLALKQVDVFYGLNGAPRLEPEISTLREEQAQKDGDFKDFDIYMTGSSHFFLQQDVLCRKTENFNS